MSSEDNIEIVRRLFEDVFSRGDYATLEELVAPDFIEHQNGAQGRGPEALRRIVAGLRQSFPDLSLSVEEVAAVGEKVWVRARGRGTDSGGVAGRPPSGATIEVDVMDLVRVQNGKIVEHWGVADRLGMLQQVGVVPAPGQERRTD
jgi:steroid delta-isomerase-like uncharacterized protein